MNNIMNNSTILSWLLLTNLLWGSLLTMLKLNNFRIIQMKSFNN